MKNQILYVEDNRFARLEAKSQLEKAFPRFIVKTARSASEVNEIINQDFVSLDKIAIVCTDGSLMEGSTGWDVVEDLRISGYDGPALYTGAIELPAEKEYLYSERCSKVGERLVETVRKHLSESANL